MPAAGNPPALPAEDCKAGSWQKRKGPEDLHAYVCVARKNVGYFPQRIALCQQHTDKIRPQEKPWWVTCLARLFILVTNV